VLTLAVVGLGFGLVILLGSGHRGWGWLLFAMFPLTILTLGRNDAYPFTIEISKKNGLIRIVRKFLGVRFASFTLPCTSAHLTSRNSFELQDGRISIEFCLPFEVDETCIEIRGAQNNDLGLAEDFEQVRADLLELFNIEPSNVRS